MGLSGRLIDTALVRIETNLPISKHYSVDDFPRFLTRVLRLVPNSRRGQLDRMDKIDAMGTMGFYFEHDANKF